jgi:hypothetical protein
MRSPMDTSTHVCINDRVDRRQKTQDSLSGVGSRRRKAKKLKQEIWISKSSAVQQERMFDVFTLFMQNKPNSEPAILT